MTFLINRIKCNTLDSVISVVLGGAARADFEAAQLMLAEHVSMLMDAVNSEAVIFWQHMRLVAPDLDVVIAGGVDVVAVASAAAVAACSMVNDIREVLSMVTMTLRSII